MCGDEMRLFRSNQTCEHALTDSPPPLRKVTPKSPKSVSVRSPILDFLGVFGCFDSVLEVVARAGFGVSLCVCTRLYISLTESSDAGVAPERSVVV